MKIAIIAPYFGDSEAASNLSFDYLYDCARVIVEDYEDFPVSAHLYLGPLDSDPYRLFARHYELCERMEVRGALALDDFGEEGRSNPMFKAFLTISEHLGHEIQPFSLRETKPATWASLIQRYEEVGVAQKQV